MKHGSEGRKDKSKSEIKQLVLLLSSAVFIAVLFSAILILYYGPTGEYYVRNILLAPEMTGKLDYSERTGGGRFVFDRVDFRYYDTEEKKWTTRTLNEEEYRKVYTLLASESSLRQVPDEVVSQFNLPNPATLTIYVKSDKTTKPFQEVVFVNKGDFYRIMLRTQDSATPWAYFHHRDIYDHVLHSIEAN